MLSVVAVVGLISIYYSLLFASASYVTGNVPANGSVTTTWARFVSDDNPPA